MIRTHVSVRQRSQAVAIRRRGLLARAGSGWLLEKGRPCTAQCQLHPTSILQPESVVPLREVTIHTAGAQKIEKKEEELRDQFYFFDLKDFLRGFVERKGNDVGVFNVDFWIDCVIVEINGHRVVINNWSGF